ncbi:MAG: hypothetical protein LBH68_04420 [Bifidobacteriaceae bacterium]|nr:hypothetical protein [Bifidobacteriaceae bacterium]
MKDRIGRLVAVAVASLSVAVAGCEADEADQGDLGPPTVAPTLPPGGFRAESFTLIGGGTPFSEYSPYLDGPPPGPEDEAYERESRAAYAQREEFLAECMGKAGFEYYAADYPTSDLPQVKYSFDQDRMVVPYLPPARQQVEQFGYGVRDPLPYVTIEDMMADAGQSEANTDYFEALSDAGQRAYNLAYFGFEELNEQTALQEQNGCAAQAYDAAPEIVNDSPAASFKWDYGNLAASMPRVHNTGVFQDTRVSTLAAEWNSCMAASGIDLSGETDTEWNPYPNALSAWYLAMRTGADGTIGPGGGGMFMDSTAPLDQRSLIGSPAEIRIALADFDCRAETDYESRFLAVQLELEQQFVDTHRGELDKMKATAQGQG